MDVSAVAKDVPGCGVSTECKIKIAPDVGMDDKNAAETMLLD